MLMILVIVMIISASVIIISSISANQLENTSSPLRSVCEVLNQTMKLRNSIVPVAFVKSHFQS